MWVQLLFVSPDCPCANTAVMSWGERRLITDCSLFLPVPLGEPYTVNWMTTPRGLNCWWDWPLPHKNSITYKKIVLITFSLMQHSFTTPLFTILDFTVSRYVTKLSHQYVLLFLFCTFVSIKADNNSWDVSLRWQKCCCGWSHFLEQSCKF